MANIELRPMVGRSGTVFNQQIVLANGRQVGYCGTRPGMPVNFTRKVSKNLKDEVVAFVQENLGEVSGTAEPILVSDDLMKSLKKVK